MPMYRGRSRIALRSSRFEQMTLLNGVHLDSWFSFPGEACGKPPGVRGSSHTSWLEPARSGMLHCFLRVPTTTNDVFRWRDAVSSSSR